MRRADCPPEMRSALGFYEALRRMGYSPDELFLLVAKNARLPDGGLCLFVIVKRDDREFTIDCGRTTLPDQAAMRAWGAWWNETTDSDRAAIFDEWRGHGRWPALVLAMAARAMYARAVG